jgi:hypothetical protein
MLIDNVQMVGNFFVTNALKHECLIVICIGITTCRDQLISSVLNIEVLAIGGIDNHCVEVVMV